MVLARPGSPHSSCRDQAIEISHQFPGGTSTAAIFATSSPRFAAALAKKTSAS